MSNFHFIPARWQALAAAPQEAEQQVYAAPLYAAMLCRKSLEEWVRWMYAHDADLVLPYDTTLSSLIHEQGFKRVVAPLHFNHINLIRKLGNTAVHTTAQIKSQEVLHALQLLHGFIGWITETYGDDVVAIPAFDLQWIPKEPGKDKSKAELQALEEAYHAQQAELRQLRDELAYFKTQKEQNSRLVPAPTDPNEALTRQIYIDTLLREAVASGRVKA